MSVNNQELKKAGLKAGMWNFSTTIINQVRNFLISLILARLLEPSDFGLVAMATASINILESFVDIGFGESIIQQKKVSQLQLSTVFYINLFLGFVISIIIFFCAPFISDFFKIPETTDILRVISLSFVIKGLQSLPSALLRKELNYSATFKINLISGFFSGILGIYLALTGYGVWSLIGSQIINWILGTILIWTYAKWKPSIEFSISSIKELWRFGSKLLITTMIDGLFFNLNPILIGKFFKASELGLYNRAASLNTLVGRYSYSAFAGVLLPALSKCQDDIITFRNNIIKIINVVCFTTSLLSGLMVCCSESLIIFLYGDKWLGAVEYFKILGFFTITGSLSNVMYYSLLSFHRSDLTLKIQIIEKILMVIAIVVGSILGIFQYVWGLCIASSIGLFFYASALKCVGLKLTDFIKYLLTYVIPFLTIVGIIYMFSLNKLTNISIINILISCCCFLVPFCLYNFIFKTMGSESALRLIKTIKTLKK